MIRSLRKELSSCGASLKPAGKRQVATLAPQDTWYKDSWVKLVAQVKKNSGQGTGIGDIFRLLLVRAKANIGATMC